jgi:hypothetical protein
MNRESKVKLANVYLVEMWEDGVLKEERYLPGKSIHYAEDCAENWTNGVIKEANEQTN